MSVPYQIKKNDILWRFYCKYYILRNKPVEAPANRCPYVERAFAGAILDIRTSRLGRYALNILIVAYTVGILALIIFTDPVPPPPGYETFDWRLSFAQTFAISCMLWATGMMLIVSTRGRRFLKKICQYFLDWTKSMCTPILPPAGY